MRNLEYIAGCGGWLECNTSALRKGLSEPYPREKSVRYVPVCITFATKQASQR